MQAFEGLGEKKRPRRQVNLEKLWRALAAVWAESLATYSAPGPEFSGRLFVEGSRA